MWAAGNGKAVGSRADSIVVLSGLWSEEILPEWGDCFSEIALETLMRYLSERREYLPNYKARRAQRQYIGSAHAEKANDLLVARRQKHRGRHWREASSDGLAALRTLLLNGGWDLYWQQHQVLPLAVPKEA